MQQAEAPQRMIGTSDASLLPFGASALNCLLNSMRLMASVSPAGTRADGVFGGLVFAGSNACGERDVFAQGRDYVGETLGVSDLEPLWKIRTVGSGDALRAFVEERADSAFALIDLRGTALAWLRGDDEHTGSGGHSFVVEFRDNGALTVIDLSVFGIGGPFAVTYGRYEAAFREYPIEVSLFDWSTASRLLTALPFESRMRRRACQARDRLKGLRTAMDAVRTDPNADGGDEDRARRLHTMIRAVALSLSDEGFWSWLGFNPTDLSLKSRKVAAALHMASLAKTSGRPDGADGRLRRRIEDASTILESVIENFSRRL